jgi:hypothetical protein
MFKYMYTCFGCIYPNLFIYRRRHLLVDTLLIPRLMLPYLERCVTHALILNSRAEAFSEMLEGDRVTELVLHNPQLVKGIAATLRTLIIASFRAPATQFVMSLLRRLNPTLQMLRATAFCKHNEYIFALLCMLNVNMGALDLSRSSSSSDGMHEAHSAHFLLHSLASVYSDMDKEKQSRVYKRVMSSGALPISRDTPSYTAVMSVLHGGAAGQLEYATGRDDGKEEAPSAPGNGAIGGDDEVWDARSEAKRAQADRLALLRQLESQAGIAASGASGSGNPADERSQPKQPSHKQRRQMMQKRTQREMRHQAPTSAY